MTAAELIRELQSQGVVLTPHADGEHLRIRPASALGPRMLAELKAQRDEVLAELRRRQEEVASHGAESSLINAEEQLAAVRLRSATFGDVWLARDEEIAAELITEVEAAGQWIPVFTFEGIPLLRGKSQRMLQVLLTAKAALPGSRLLQ